MMTTTGIVMLCVTVALYIWGVPRPDEESRVPQRWGMRTLFPSFIICLGVTGFLLLVKGVFY